MMNTHHQLTSAISGILNKRASLFVDRRVLAPALISAIFFCYNPAANADILYTSATTFKLDGENPHSAVIADFNEDGTDDLAAVFSVVDKITGLPGSRLNFLAGNTTGALKIEMTENLSFDVRSMAAGDFDGDGQTDLAVAQKLPQGGSLECGAYEGTVIYFGSHSDIEPRITFGGCITEVPAGKLLTFDANGDGFDDLLIGDNLLLGYGDGTFTQVNELPSGDKNIIDLNADGILDVISDSETLCGIGDGFFNACNSIANEPLVETNLDGKIVTKNKLNDAVMKLNKQETADINGDGIEDLVGWAVTSLETPRITYWSKCSWRVVTVRSFRKRAGSGRGSGYYVSRRMNQYTCSTRNYEVAGWDRISYLSAAPIPSTTALRASIVQADGTVEQMMGPDVDGVILSLRLTDVNGDGNIDALAYIAQSNNEGHYVAHPDYPTWTFFPGVGDGNFSPPMATNLPLDHAIPGDWNGDGLMDFGRYISPVDSEHLLSVIYHEPASVVVPDPAPDPVPAPSEPGGQTIEISGVVSEVYADYFMIGNLRVNVDASSIIKFEDDFGPNINVGDPVEGKAEQLSDGTTLAIKAEFG